MANAEQLWRAGARPGRVAWLLHACRRENGEEERESKEKKGDAADVATKFDKERLQPTLAHPRTWTREVHSIIPDPVPLHLIRPTKRSTPAFASSFSFLSPVPSGTQPPAATHPAAADAATRATHPTPQMAASLRSPPPVPAAFRRSRAVVRASSSSSSSSSAVSSSSGPKARFVARRSESTSVKQLDRPLAEYMSLPASQYSVLDAERIERVDDSTFRCYVYRFRFFALEVCPVLLVRVDEEPNGCCIRLLSCKLEGSPLVEAQNDKFSASMVNRVYCHSSLQDSTFQQLTSDTTIEVAIDIPFPFRAIPVEAIESSGRQVLEQLLRVMLPRFLKQLDKDYKAWASGDSSRKPLGTGEI